MSHRGAPRCVVVGHAAELAQLGRIPEKEDSGSLWRVLALPVSSILVAPQHRRAS